jgi:hypothetical protein
MTADSRFDPLQADPPQKPRRGWPRRLTIAFLLLLVAAGGAFAVWYSVCKSARDAEIAKVRAMGEPVWFEDLKPAPVDADKDGMPILRQAFAAMKPLPDELAQEMLSLNDPEEETEDGAISAKFLEEYGDIIIEPEGINLRDWVAKHQKKQPDDKTPRLPLAVREKLLVEKLRPLVSANQAPYELVRAAIARPRFAIALDFDSPAPMWMERPDINQFFELHKLLQARMRCEIYDGKQAEAFATVIESLKLAQRWQFAHDTSLVERLISATVAGMALKSLAEIMSHGNLDDSQVSEVDRLLFEIESDTRIRPAFVGERAMAMTTIENFYENGGMDGEPITNPLEQLVLQPLVWNNQTYYLRAIGPMIEYADRYDEEASEATKEAWMREIAPLEDGEIRGLGKISRMAVALLIPATASVERVIADNRNRLLSARAGLRVDAYFREHGRFPKSLDEVVGKELPAVPNDIVESKPLVLIVERNGFAVCAAGVHEREHKLLAAEIKKQQEPPEPAANRDPPVEANGNDDADIEVGVAETAMTDDEEYSTAFRVIYRTRPAR